MSTLPKARHVRRSAECLCGKLKPLGDLVCPDCWNKTNGRVQLAMHRSGDRTLKMQAEKHLMEQAAYRKPI